MIHIFSAPRSGSTLLLQFIVNHFRVNYFGNDGQIHNADELEVSYDSKYGKTFGDHEPTEASKILECWFGVGKYVLSDMEQRVKSTIQAAEPFVMKNIWNVWRVEEWERLVSCKWIWIKRDISAATLSDYHSRNGQGGMNGAYLQFCQDIGYLSPMDQAARQQRDINAIIEENLQGRDFIQLWYRNLVERPGWELLRLERFLDVERRHGRTIPKLVNHND